MKRLLLALPAALAILAATVAPVGAITKNYEPDFDHPFVGLVAFYDANGDFVHRCTGELLAPTVVLTAGHCTDNGARRRQHHRADLVPAGRGCELRPGDPARPGHRVSGRVRRRHARLAVCQIARHVQLRLQQLRGLPQHPRRLAWSSSTSGSPAWATPTSRATASSTRSTARRAPQDKDFRVSGLWHQLRGAQGRRARCRSASGSRPSSSWSTRTRRTTRASTSSSTATATTVAAPAAATPVAQCSDPQNTQQGRGGDVVRQERHLPRRRLLLPDRPPGCHRLDHRPRQVPTPGRSASTDRPSAPPAAGRHAPDAGSIPRAIIGRMYVPAHFQPSDDEVREALRHLGAVDLVTATDDGLLATLMPMLWDEPGSRPGLGPWGALVGHVARNNAQWRTPAIGDAMVIVRGPDAYISPRWYAAKREHGRVVPTWNYVTVQAHGRLVVHDDVEWLETNVRRLTDAHEADAGEPWSVDDAPRRYIDGQLRAIVGIEVLLDRVVGKWKLGQNRSDADIVGAIEGLEAAGERGVSAAMRAAPRRSRAER